MKMETQYIAENIELKERNQKLKAELFLANSKLKECNRIIQELQEKLNIRAAKLFSPKTETETSMQIDETGYFPIHRDDASQLFQLIARRYEKKSTAVTTNLKLSKWGDMFGDAMVANVILDRLLHHSNVFVIKGKPYRTKDYADKEGGTRSEC
ncbi:MAG: ATP-binding protein [Candidatus Enterosoma sp.]|nr:ATP-binding protein [Candidatus Enterosoma sp.]